MITNPLSFALVVLLGAAAGCADSGFTKPPNNNSTGFNNVEPDMGADADTSDSDSDSDMGGTDQDMDIPPSPEEFSVVEDRGRDLFVLRGIILGPDGPFEGELAISPPLISCIATDCSGESGYDNATIIETGGIISPGLIDSHNHLAYNFLPEWRPGQAYTNRYQWSDDPSYEEHIAPYANHRSAGSHYCPAARWGELRSLMAGTTTMQGQSFNQKCVQGTIRNADHKQNLQYDHLRTTIGSVRDINDAAAAGYIASFDDPTDPTTRFAVHMAEGTSGDNIELEFGSFAGRDTRNNRHAGVSLLYNETAILIHAVGLTAAELGEVRDTGSKIVWSPSSNFALYGQTADIETILSLGITVGLGPDWTLSGEDDLPSEMRFALEYADQASIPAVTPEVLWRMVTSEGAKVVGLQDYIGKLEVGMIADISVFQDVDPNPYLSVVKATPSTILLVFIGGDALYGESEARVAVARDEDCELQDVCGRTKFVCAADQSIDNGFFTIAETEQQLVDILEGNGYPADEQYGRGDDLLPLWSCQ